GCGRHFAGKVDDRIGGALAVIEIPGFKPAADGIEKSGDAGLEGGWRLGAEILQAFARQDCPNEISAQVWLFLLADGAAGRQGESQQRTGDSNYMSVIHEAPP